VETDGLKLSINLSSRTSFEVQLGNGPPFKIAREMLGQDEDSTNVQDVMKKFPPQLSAEESEAIISLLTMLNQ
jgi:hypothetical protein